MRIRLNPKRQDVVGYLSIVAHLRAIQWLAWNAHWVSSGPNAYGMHLLLERLYSGKGDDAPGPNIEEHIDEIGERIVAYFGNSAIDPAQLNHQSTLLLQSVAKQETDPVCQLLCLERSLQRVLKDVWEKEQSSKDRSLGLDDYLMGLANERDTVIYLLQQTWR